MVNSSAVKSVEQAHIGEERTFVQEETHVFHDESAYDRPKELASSSQMAFEAMSFREREQRISRHFVLRGRRRRGGEEESEMVICNRR